MCLVTLLWPSSLFSKCHGFDLLESRGFLRSLLTSISYLARPRFKKVVSHWRLFSDRKCSHFALGYSATPCTWRIVLSICCSHFRLRLAWIRSKIPSFWLAVSRTGRDSQKSPPFAWAEIRNRKHTESPARLRSVKTFSMTSRRCSKHWARRTELLDALIVL